MSIPPLVCSTPPPPDQCEEDNDPEDFDIPYNLSQDDDDDGYDYGNFSSYNYQVNADIKKVHELCDNVEVLSSYEDKDPIDINSIAPVKDELGDETNKTPEDQNNCKKDTSIEDLALENSEESLDTSHKAESEVINSFSLESCISDNNVENEVPDDYQPPLSPSQETNDNSVESLSIEDKPNSDEDVVISTNYDEIEISSQPTNSEADLGFCSKAVENLKDESHNLDDDDFGDFDDFQFTSAKNKASPILDNCENPWDKNEPENVDFGNFTANFEVTEDENTVDFDPISETVQNKAKQNDPVEDDDDFGDFDDFKSSAVESTTDLEDTSCNDQAYINFQLPDNETQLMESISNVLCSVFEDELTKPDTEFEGKLESVLSETWRHLRETDVRQPYIVNWNNSFGQKTLLRALCIDSRNILFGPKWGYSMPKYAVNLSNAPLQPQKPLTPSNSSQSEATTAEKTTTKSGAWVDPFTSDGQESCNTESESVVQVTSSDLDVFEVAIATKPEKIYSSTLNVQPLRQINLPDTHIFTPTDSETPRSKTIHYDTVTPILLPQTTLENKQPVDDFTTEDDDDWEFQDFRGSSGSTSLATGPQPKEHIEPKPKLNPKSNVTYQTQVLEPIKMEPLMPSLNWPDPGQVKETFEDFSDFISNMDNKPPHITSPQQGKAIPESVTLEEIEDKHECLETEQTTVTQPVSQEITSDHFDDDFDTFQSALPTKNSSGEFAFESSGKNAISNIPSTSRSPSIIKDFDYTFPKINSNKSDIISFENTIRPNEALTQSLRFNPTLELTPNTNTLPLGNTISSNLLQPLPVNSTTSHKTQKTTQILQPLSLESYSQINWPNPGIDLQDLSRFNPVETLQSLKSDLSAASGSGGSSSKGASPAHVTKNLGNNQPPDDDIWGEFVSSKPKQQALPKKAPVFPDDDEWTDFVSSPSVKPQNGLNTISLNVHTNSNIQKTINNNKFASKNAKAPLDIPTLNYITPKSSGHNAYNERHFQNL